MKLDRNINPDGQGKYALVNWRKFKELESKRGAALSHELRHAVAVLANEGVLSFGNESNGEQFFVMKYKDKFTASALKAYADAVHLEVYRMEVLGKHDESRSLSEYAHEIEKEAAYSLAEGNRIPD